MGTSEDKYRSLRQIPPFPAIATKLLRALSHEDAHIREIVDLIRVDASLSSELLRVVNSPVYGFAGRISSIQSAVMLLGLDTVKSFALTVTMKGFLHGALRLDLLRRIWRHSLACGMVCEEISGVVATPMGRDDRAYTAGLLHNVGTLGLFVAHPKIYAEVLEEADGATLLDRERAAFGVDHCEAGDWLAAKWGLPAELRLAAGGHHAPPDTAVFDLVDVVRTGVLLTDALGFDVVTPAHPYTVCDIRALLPHTAQYRFDPDSVQMTARITGRLDAFD